jgi:hypothetical protein
MDTVRPKDDEARDSTSLAVSRITATAIIFAGSVWALLQIGRLERLMEELDVFLIMGKDWMPAVSKILSDGSVLASITTGVVALSSLFYIWIRAKRSLDVVLVTVATTLLLTGVGGLYGLGMTELREAFARQSLQ